jgi:hypothetical protein
MYAFPETESKGMVTVVEPELLVPGASEGMLRLPSRVSDSSTVLFSDR